MYTFTIPRDEFDELRPDKQMIRKLIGKHIGLVGRLKKNMNYYRGKHKILEHCIQIKCTHHNLPFHIFGRSLNI